jgi:hypothetical protein
LPRNAYSRILGFMRARVIAIVALCSLIASPLFACLPNSSMTPAEMECCKKMAGHCDMGGGNHKCCDTTVNRPAPSAMLAHNSSASDFSLAIVAWTDWFVLFEVPPHPSFGQSSASISPSPPGFLVSLRI